MAPPSTLPPADVLYKQAKEHGFCTAAEHARSLPGVKVNTLQKALSDKDWGTGLREIYQANNRERAKREGDDLTVSQELPAKTSTRIDPDSDEVRAFCKERGINTDEFVPVSAIVKRYPIQLGEGQVEEADYLSVTTKRKTGMTVLEVAPPPKLRKVTPLRPKKGEPEITVLMGCHQIPYHDERAHELVCGFLAMVQPHRWSHLGDLPDYATISRHKKGRKYAVGVDDTHVVAHRILMEMRDATPHSKATLKPGNHDNRLPEFVLGNLPSDVADLAPVGETDPWWHPRRMLHLDALGVEYIDPVDDMWERARLRLAPTLTAMHGWRTGKATAARDTAAELGISVITAHTHRQVLTRVTTGREECPHVLWAMEVGCLCKLDASLGYVRGISDWQQGVGVASVWPDGSFHLELAQIDEGALHFRGQRYSPRQLRVAA